jgi:hypothetical protein
MLRAILLTCLLSLSSLPARGDEGRRVRKTLVTPIDMLPIPENTPLEDVVSSLSERFRFPIVIDTAAFQAADIRDIEQQGVKLPKLTGVSLHTTLRLIVGQVNGAIVQLGGQVWIVPPNQRIPRMMGQKIDVRHKDLTIGQVIEDLQERTGANIELFPNLGAVLERKVTCDWKQVRLDRAIERLASLAKLEVVLDEGCLYIALPDDAHQLRMLIEADMPR